MDIRREGLIAVGCTVMIGWSTGAAKAQTQVQVPYDEQARIRSAQELIAENQEYIKQSKLLHARLEQTLLVAQKLQGHATELDLKATGAALTPHLTGAQLKAAQAQFAADLDNFKLHAQDYQNHLQQFRGTIGECHANEQMFQAQLGKFEIHADKFHMPNIRPPHICGALNVTEHESTQMANMIRSDQQRTIAAEAQLRSSENKLAGEMAQTNVLAQRAMNENHRAQAEQKLSDEFTRLKAEYETLAVEHTAIGGNVGGKLTSTTVHGTIKSK